ncbi:MAG: hypothetical protein E7018_00260 [Alphaproteobacteria bacterium]|nr:hypothetical protein [Alphaproteobacteria bacterium]
MKKINKKEFEKLYKNHSDWLTNNITGKQLKLVNCSFTKDCLSNMNLNNSIFENCDFSNCDLTNTKFENSIIQKCNFINAQYLSINAFGFSNLYGTKLPFSYSQKIEYINDHSSKYKIISLLYCIICIYYILFALSASYSDFFLGTKINIPNPFFDLTGMVSYTTFLCFGIIIVFALDKFLIPLTLEIMAMIRTLPVIFPDGERISTVLSKYFLLRWITELQIDFKGLLPISNIKSQNMDKNLKLDYNEITNHTIALFRFLDFICLYLFLSRILHIYFFDIAFLNLSENELQMILGVFFIFKINHSGNTIHPITSILLILALATFIDINNIGTNITKLLSFNKPTWMLSLFIVVTSVLSYHFIPQKTKMNSILPIYIVIITIYFSNYHLSNITLENISFNTWSGICEKEQISKYTNKRFINGNLKKIQASNINFSNSNFTNANLQNADFRCSNFSNAILTNADIKGADLRYATGIKDVICNTINYQYAKLSFTPNCKKTHSKR